MNFGSKLGCTSVDFYWTLLPEFTYSVEAICGNTTKIYPDLTSNSLSMELFGDQESCDIFLSGKSLDGGTQKYSLTVPLFQGKVANITTYMYVMLIVCGPCLMSNEPT